MEAPYKTKHLSQIILTIFFAPSVKIYPTLPHHKRTMNSEIIFPIGFPLLFSYFVKYIQSLNMNKALGHDNISPLFLKTARDIVAPFLQVFIDFSFKNGIFPDNCKTAKIFPLHKKGDVNNPSNFRPISILSCFSKIYEQVLYNRLVKFLDKHVITPSQYGFQKGISTTVCL